MSTLAERMAISFKEIQTTNPSKTKAGLARAAGVTPSSVSDWFNGRTKQLRFDVANRAAAYLEVSAQWLANGSGEMHSPSVVAFDEYDELNDDDFVEIPEYEAKCAAGERCAVYFEELKDSVKARYRRSWFQARQINPDNCRRFKVHGTSMEPFIWDGDTILVDCTPQQIMGGKTYAFMLHGDMRVKMLYPLMKGQLLVKPLNPDVPDETLGSDDLDTFELIGRVRDRSGDAKL